MTPANGLKPSKASGSICLFLRAQKERPTGWSGSERSFGLEVLSWAGGKQVFLKPKASAFKMWLTKFFGLCALQSCKNWVWCLEETMQRILEEEQLSVRLQRVKSPESQQTRDVWGLVAFEGFWGGFLVHFFTWFFVLWCLCVDTALISWYKRGMAGLLMIAGNNWCILSHQCKRTLCPQLWMILIQVIDIKLPCCPASSSFVARSRSLGETGKTGTALRRDAAPPRSEVPCMRSRRSGRASGGVKEGGFWVWCHFLYFFDKVLQKPAVFFRLRFSFFFESVWTSSCGIAFLGRFKRTTVGERFFFFFFLFLNFC